MSVERLGIYVVFVLRRKLHTMLVLLNKNIRMNELAFAASTVLPAEKKWLVDSRALSYMTHEKKLLAD